MSRNIEELGHRVSESAEVAGHKLKEATVGDSQAKNVAKEKTHQGSNRVSETLNRAGDAVANALRGNSAGAREDANAASNKRT